MSKINEDTEFFKSKVREAVAKILSTKERNYDIEKYVITSEFDLESMTGDEATMKAIANEIGADELERLHREFFSYSDGEKVFNWTIIDDWTDEEKEMIAKKLEAFRLSLQIERLMNGIDENQGA